MNPSPTLRSWSRTCSRMLGAAALCAFMASFANGEVIGGYFGGTQRTDGGQVVGASFNSFGATFSSLGFFDFGQDGLAASYQVGLWDSSQNLLASATVTPSSPLIGDFRYASISPITIGTFANPQTFTIGALLPASMPDVWLQASGLVLNVGFTGAGTGQFTPSGSLVYPTSFDNSPYYVVNAGGPIPEPSTLALFGLSLLGLAVVRSRRVRR